jgi:hypothetical protein
MKRRKKIPKEVKNIVRERQKGRCAICLDYGREYHHLLAYCLQKKHHVSNIFLLCKKHHNLFHLGDYDTIQSLYEYAWYVINGKLPEQKDISDISKEVYNKLLSIK